MKKEPPCSVVRSIDNFEYSHTLPRIKSGFHDTVSWPTSIVQQPLPPSVGLLMFAKIDARPTLLPRPSCRCCAFTVFRGRESEDTKDFSLNEMSSVFFKMDAVVLCLRCISRIGGKIRTV